MKPDLVVLHMRSNDVTSKDTAIVIIDRIIDIKKTCKDYVVKEVVSSPFFCFLKSKLRVIIGMTEFMLLVKRNFLFTLMKTSQIRN